MARSIGQGRGQAGGRGVCQTGGQGDWRGSSGQSGVQCSGLGSDTVGRGSGKIGGRCAGQIGGRGSSGQNVGQGVGQTVGQTRGQSGVQGSGLGSDTVGRGSGKIGGRCAGQIGGRGSSGQIGGRSVGQIGGQGDGRSSSGQSGIQGCGLSSSDTIGRGSGHTTSMPSRIEGSDGDDESIFHVASARRGPASQVQAPEPTNREWIWIEDGEFSNQVTSTRIIGSNLRAMWSGPWESWGDVSNEDKTRLFERFQWEEKWNAQVYMCWEKCIAGKFANLLVRVRDVAKETARKQGFQVGDDMSVLTDFKPAWIRTEIWKQMIDIWNTPEWKAKSQRNKKIRRESRGGKHTLGAQTYMTVKRKVAHTMGREPSHCEMWRQSHCKKGCRPLDKYLSRSSSLADMDDGDLEELDSEGEVQEENLDWVDDRAEETWVKYEGYFVNKYGKEHIKHAKVDEELWSLAAGGKNKGKVYGLCNVSDPSVHGRRDPEIENLNKVIKELVTEKERLNGIIEELVAEKEKDKVEKDAMLNRMANIEAILKVRL